MLFTDLYFETTSTANYICFVIDSVKTNKMKKGILIVAVLITWFFAKNREYVQLITAKEIKPDKKATLFAQELKKDLFQFTTVHLYSAKKEKNNSKHTQKLCLKQATNNKQLHNHEPLLIVNGL
jgi:hypothetical protein